MTILLKPPLRLINTSELWCFAQTILGEAEGEALAGKVAVGWVIVNRAKLRGQMLTQVCRAPLQFSCWNSGSPRLQRMLNAALSDPYFCACHGVAALILAGEFADPTKGADHYFTTAMPEGAKIWPPVWAKAMTKTVMVGAHSFYRS